jgi:hypothetical protein
MARKRICISFDYEHDRNYRYLLNALEKDQRNRMDFDDITPSEIDTASVARVKQVLTTKIRSATHLLVIVGKYANSLHPDRVEIGTRNWQWWEIEKAKVEGKGLIAVKIDSANSSPDPLQNANASWAYSYTEDAIVKAIDAA